MKKQKKQNILTTIIIILVIALVMMIGSIVYEEKINMNKQPAQNTNAPAINEEEKDNEKNEDELEENDNAIVEEDSEASQEKEELPAEDNKDEEYVGEEENKTEEPEMTTDDKVIDLVKKEWGQDDSVTFSIEKKNGTKYRVAVRDSSTTVLQWYEVDTQNWEVSEY